MNLIQRKQAGARRRLTNAWDGLMLPAQTAPDPAQFRRNTEPGRFGEHPGAATEILHGRLSAEDLVEIARRAKADDTMIDLPAPPGAAAPRARLTEGWQNATGLEKKRLDLTFGVLYEIPSVLEKTGLSPAMPPEDVHAMTHSSLGAGGSFYHADLVLDAVAAAGADLSAGDAGLDFGCSSGRVVRVLNAARPDVEWHGCDPNGPATEWASANIAGVEFATSPSRPPLAQPDSHFALAFGISIWSHFDAAAALAWYGEMHRLLRPGGHLVTTTHGLQSIDFYASVGLRSAEQLTEIRDALYTDGYWYAAEFGEDGDWGVVDTAWGTSFHTAEWLLEQLTPRWQVATFAPAGNESNQDVYVLRRV